MFPTPATIPLLSPRLCYTKLTVVTEGNSWTNANADRLAQVFSPEQLIAFLRRAAPAFRPARGFLNTSLTTLKARQRFDRAEQVGYITCPAEASVLVAAVHVRGELSSRSSKRTQYGLAKAILKTMQHEAGLFAFYDDQGRFRLSLVTARFPPAFWAPAALSAITAATPTLSPPRSPHRTH